LAFFGELYLRSTLPFLGAEVTARETAYLGRAFAGVKGPIVDVGCGHGRHAAALRRDGLPVVGLELDPLALAERLSGFPAVRGDLRALPFGTARLHGVYAWYSTLFIFEDEAHLALLRGLRRTLKSGAKLVFHTVPYERLAAAPAAQFSTTLPDGSVLTEQSRFDPVTGRDHGLRRLTLPDGRVLSGAYAIRYYRETELEQLLAGAGLAIKWVHGDLQGGALGPTSTDLIIGAEASNG
jgi:SAM-dependent methyltransferase